jgi:hypothetical protein
MKISNCFVFSVFALAACGGNNPQSSITTKPVVGVITPASISTPTPAPAPVPASTPVVQIAVFGDDQTMGDTFNSFGMMSMTSPTAPQDLQTLLQAQFDDSGVTISNASTGGTASSLQNELAGMDGGGQPEPARMIESGAQIAIEAHSINDLYGGETVEQYQADLIQWVEDAQQAGIQPVLQEPSPACNSNDPSQPEYVAAIDSVGQQLNVPVIPLYAYVQSLPDWESHMQGCEIPDATLNQLEAQQAQKVIGPIVARLMGQ